jgi:hypothetical protein
MLQMARFSSPKSQSTSRRPASTRSSAPPTSTSPTAPTLLRFGLLLQSIPLRLALIIHECVDANLATKVFDACPTHVHLVWALPAGCNGGPRAWCSAMFPQDAVVLEKIFCSLRSSRQSLDGRFVVAVCRSPPFLSTGHRA